MVRPSQPADRGEAGVATNSKPGAFHQPKNLPHLDYPAKFPSGVNEMISNSIERTIILKYNLTGLDCQ